MINSSTSARRPLGTIPTVSSLTNDPALQRIFRRIEDEGAAEVVPTFRPRPTAPAAVRELVEA